MRGFSIVIALLWLLVSSASAQYRGCGPNQIQISAREYTNQDYGYRITLPENAQVCRMKAPAPDHGVTIYPAPPTNAEVRIYAEYDALLEGSAGRLAEHVAETFTKQYHLTIATDRSVRLGGLAARDLVLRAAREPDGDINYVHFIMASRSVPGEVGIVYTLLIQGPKKTEIDEKVLSNLATSFRVLPITNKP